MAGVWVHCETQLAGISESDVGRFGLCTRSLAILASSLSSAELRFEALGCTSGSGASRLQGLFSGSGVSAFWNVFKLATFLRMRGIRLCGMDVA